MTRLALLAAVLAIAGCSADSKPATTPVPPKGGSGMTDPNLRDDAKRAAMTPPTGGKMDMEKK